jgi:hypothetical protein
MLKGFVHFDMMAFDGVWTSPGQIDSVCGLSVEDIITKKTRIRSGVPSKSTRLSPRMAVENRLLYGRPLGRRARRPGRVSWSQLQRLRPRLLGRLVTSRRSASSFAIGICTSYNFCRVSKIGHHLHPFTKCQALDDGQMRMPHPFIWRCMIKPFPHDGLYRMMNPMFGNFIKSPNGLLYLVITYDMWTIALGLRPQ